MEALLKIKGYTGQLTVAEEKIIIQRKGLMGFVARGGMAGDKEIPIKSITAIEFRKGNFLTNGRIQFSIHGELGHKGGSVGSVSDENTIIFTKSQNEVFLKAKDLIEKLMMNVDEKPKSQNANPISSADELMKFAKLKENGLITQEEFDIKKKEILGA